MHVEIEYCVPCGFQEQAMELQLALLERYGRDIDGVTLRPSHGGVFEVTADDDPLWDRDVDGGIDVEAVLDRLDSA